MKNLTNSLLLAIYFSFLGFILTKAQANLCIVSYRSKIDPTKLIDPNVFKVRLLSTGKPGQVLLGFESDNEGKLMPVWADSKDFQSIRHVQTNGFFGATGWNHLREAILVRAKFSQHSILNKRKDNEQVFPEEIEKHLLQGSILETDQPQGPLTYERLIELINSIKEEWHVLMMAASPNENESMTKMEGRTGVILKNGIPFGASFKNEGEVVLEQKGIGLPAGGYQNPIRTTHGNISGGVSGVTANQEFSVGQNLKDLTRVRIPLIAEYEGLFGKQGVVFRWAPGTRRSSFSYPEEGKYDSSTSYLKSHASDLSVILGKTIVQIISRGYLPRLHMENFVVSANSKKVDLTDFADIHPLSKLVRSIEFIPNLISHLDFLLEKNYVNLGYDFDKKAFISSIISESDFLGLPQSSLKKKSPSLQKTPGHIENALGDSQNENIRYVIFRAVAAGLSRSLGQNPVAIKHQLKMEEFKEQLKRSFSAYRSSFQQLEISFSNLNGRSPRDMDEYDRKIYRSYEEALLAKRMVWTLEGAETYLNKPEFRNNYREYLKRFSVSYVNASNGPNESIPGGIDRIPEFKKIIESQRKLVISYDLLWRSYEVTGQEKMASYYRDILEELFNLSPLEYLERYQ